MQSCAGYKYTLVGALAAPLKSLPQPWSCTQPCVCKGQQFAMDFCMLSKLGRCCTAVKSGSDLLLKSAQGREVLGFWEVGIRALRQQMSGREAVDFSSDRNREPRQSENYIEHGNRAHNSWFVATSANETTCSTCCPDIPREAWPSYSANAVNPRMSLVHVVLPACDCPPLRNVLPTTSKLYAHHFQNPPP